MFHKRKTCPQILYKIIDKFIYTYAHEIQWKYLVLYHRYCHFDTKQLIKNSRLIIVTVRRSTIDTSYCANYYDFNYS